MRMIGISGRAGAGKTFVANELKSLHANGEIVSFAAQLRKEIEQVLGVGVIPRLWNKPTSPEIRFILQQYGTQFRREQDDDYWVKRGMQEALNLQQLGRLVIFDDVRFPNEADAITEAGGILVRMECGASVRRDRLGGELPPEHASETSMDFHEHDFQVYGVPGETHDTQVRSVFVEATLEDIDFMGAINESLTNRE